MNKTILTLVVILEGSEFAVKLIRVGHRNQIIY